MKRLLRDLLLVVDYTLGALIRALDALSQPRHERGE
jgi:hypothetical protein